MVITEVELQSFRGFQYVRAEVAPHAFVVGANSAGKSTILEAIGLAERCLRIARRIKPEIEVSRAGLTLRSFRLPPSLDDEEDPVRHEFKSAEASIVVRWNNGCTASIVWPEDDGDEAPPFFFLETGDGTQPTAPWEVRGLFAPVTVIPVITPLDRAEPLKDPKYIEKHSATRLASRHFRNHLLRMSSTADWPPFLEFCTEWLPEMMIDEVYLDQLQNRISVFYKEPKSRVPKELSWSGDGLQIYVQLLWHLFAARDASTVVLDEPEVYLHPTLQRRLISLLISMRAQIIIASHSASIVGQAPQGCILHVDRRRNFAVRANDVTALAGQNVA
jgi:hypothetical protein